MKRKTNGTMYQRFLVSIASSIVIILFFLWAGIRGMVGFIAGMGIMCYLLLSRNPLLLFIIEMFGEKLEK